MSFSAHLTAQFRKDFKACVKSKFPMEELHDVMKKLVSGGILPPQYKDHQLKGNFSRFRECHISGKASDWILVYRYDGKDKIIFARTGNHSKVLGK